MAAGADAIRAASLSAFAAVALAACAAPQVSEQAARAAYNPGYGPYSIQETYRTELDFRALDKQLSMRVVFPEAQGRYPLIVLSHGNGCYQDLYRGFANHWASWGYVVVQPVHMDSRETGFSMKSATVEVMNEVIATRQADVRFILDSLDELETRVPGLADKIDRDRMVMAGHSMGAGTAMMLTGVVMVDPRDERAMGEYDERFDALIVISEPSNNRLMPDEPWRLARVPTLVATGSEDFSTIGARDGKKSKYAYRLPADAAQPDEPRYYLYMDGSDHYLGGVICRDDMPGPPDEDALNIINGAAVAFMRATVDNDRASQAFLESGAITPLTNGRATLDQR